LILLGIDTCGQTGSIALGRQEGESLFLLGQAEFSGGEYAAAIVKGIADILESVGLAVNDLNGIVVVMGPGTFTGIRIGLSTAKGLAEALNLPVVAISRLALLASLAQTNCAALDAHRGQVFLGLYGDGATREVLVTAGEFTTVSRLPGLAAFCEESVAHLLETVVTEVELVRTTPPNAADALKFSLSRWLTEEFVDLATLDGYYLRGAEAKLAPLR